jgi:hypothetical protein
MNMSGDVMTIPEVARALGRDGAEVYRLIDCGELDAHKGPDGLVYVRPEAVRAYQDRGASAAR